MKFPSILLFAAALLACARLSADNPEVTNGLLVQEYTNSLVVSDERKAELMALAKASAEDFAAKLATLPQLKSLFADQLANPKINQFFNAEGEQSFAFRLAFGPQPGSGISDKPIVPPPPADPSNPVSSCTVNFYLGTAPEISTTSAHYALPVMKEFRINYFFKINPSDPALEKSVNDAFQQTVLNFALKAGLTNDDIKNFLPGLSAFYPGNVATPAFAPAHFSDDWRLFLESSMLIYPRANATPPPSPTRAKFLQDLAVSTLKKIKDQIDAPVPIASALPFNPGEARLAGFDHGDQFQYSYSFAEGVKMEIPTIPGPQIASYPVYPPGSFEIIISASRNCAPPNYPTREYDLDMFLPPGSFRLSARFELGTPDAALEKKFNQIFDAAVLDYLVQGGMSKIDITHLYPQLAYLSNKLPGPAYTPPTTPAPPTGPATIPDSIIFTDPPKP